MITKRAEEVVQLDRHFWEYLHQKCIWTHYKEWYYIGPKKAEYHSTIYLMTWVENVPLHPTIQLYKKVATQNAHKKYICSYEMTLGKNAIRAISNRVLADVIKAFALCTNVM